MTGRRVVAAIALAAAVSPAAAIATTIPRPARTHHAGRRAHRRVASRLSAHVHAGGGAFGLPAAATPVAPLVAPSIASAVTAIAQPVAVVAAPVVTAITAPATLPSRTGVLLTEFRVAPTRDPLAAGDIELDATNGGEDAHDLTIARDGIVLGTTGVLAPGEQSALHAHLDAGDYTLYCSLFGGAHDAAGMHATLHVR